MFDVNGYEDFVGEKSAVSYVSGLRQIEQLFDTDVDTCFADDKCILLLKKLNERKKENSLSETERKSASDMHSHLKKYVDYRNSINTKENIDSRITNIISLYKKDFIRVNKDERFKWEAVLTYKNVWNIDTDNFASMIASAFRNHGTLLRAGNYYPYKMLTNFAQEEPETVRMLFKTLYDESLSFEERYIVFKDGFNSFFSSKKLNHYQDLHAVSVYLSFEYPEKYFIYKYRVLKDFLSQIGFYAGNIDAMTDVEKFDLHLEVCNRVLSVIDEDTKEISMERLDDSCYRDENFHMLTHDIIYFGSTRLTSSNPDNKYWPTFEEYDPHISTSDWINVLNNKDVTTVENLKMLKMILEQGGESTCAHLADIYGNIHNYYNKLGSSYGQKVKKQLNCPDCYDNGVSRFFPIPFIGRNIIEDNCKRYSWKLRNELEEALNQMDLSEIITKEKHKLDISKNTILYGPPGTGKTYNTVIYAVAIIENKMLNEVKSEQYETVLERYNRYKADGLIEFTTFHQSYGYEEFIEGIKPIIDNDSEERNGIQYDILPGVFKKFCNETSVPSNMGLNPYTTVWKVSLEGTGENTTRTECLKNNHIRIGWDEYGEAITDDTDFKDGGKAILNAFICKMKRGDIVFSCYSATTIDAIGVISGDYEWHDEYSDYKRVRSVTKE